MKRMMTVGVLLALLYLTQSMGLDTGDGFRWRRFKLPGHGALELLAPADWHAEAKQPGNDLPPTITFSPVEGDSFKILITVILSPVGDPSFNDLPKILPSIEKARDDAAKSSVPGAISVQELHGEHLKGYYFSATDRAPKKGEYRYVTQGAAGLQDLLLTFTVLSNDSKQVVSEASLVMFRAARKASPESLGATSATPSGASGILVESGNLKDPSLGLSFAIPEGWTLDAKSSSGHIVLTHLASGSTVTVQVKPKAVDLNTEFRALEVAVPFLGGKWSRIDHRWTKVGGMKAGELESTRTHDDGKTWHEWNLVTVQNSQALLLWLAVPEDEVKARRTEFDQILSSLRWENE